MVGDFRIVTNGAIFKVQVQSSRGAAETWIDRAPTFLTVEQARDYIQRIRTANDDWRVVE
jgi:hypothetical protein